MHTKDKEDRLIPIATKSFVYYEDMYKLVDFLNKNIKEQGIILGLTKEKETGRMGISIYRT